MPSFACLFARQAAIWKSSCYETWCNIEVQNPTTGISWNSKHPSRASEWSTILPCAESSAQFTSGRYRLHALLNYKLNVMQHARDQKSRHAHMAALCVGKMRAKTWLPDFAQTSRRESGNDVKTWVAPNLRALTWPRIAPSHLGRILTDSTRDTPRACSECAIVVRSNGNCIAGRSRESPSSSFGTV